jgi:hypothetical protein
MSSSLEVVLERYPRIALTLCWLLGASVLKKGKICRQ